MICINQSSLNPYFNLAAEEYLLKSSNEDIMMLWQSSPSIVVGKHQNMLAEINYPFVLQNGIDVVRRLSGGGTVFHDSGNINFTFIVNGAEGRQVDFKRFTLPIIEFLNTNGIPAVLSGRNDILIDGFKFSGNAEHVYKSRVLHHGTILFDADLEMLSQGIKPTGAVYTDTSVKSTRSKVANLASYFNPAIRTEEFRNMLFEYLLGKYDTNEHLITEYDKSQIIKLANDKYQSWEWNFGYSPAYRFNSKGGGVLNLGFTAEKGVIVDAAFSKNGEKIAVPSVCNLIGVKHDSFTELANILKQDYIFSGLNEDELLDLLY